MAGKKRVQRGPGQYFVDDREYIRLLERMGRYVHDSGIEVDCVIGVIRSGLFPAVYLSHQLKLPFFCSSDVNVIPPDRFSKPLIVDTSCWSGGSIRTLQAKLIKRGFANVQAIAMYIRNYPRPEVDNLHHLERCDHIMNFWYDIEGVVEDVVKLRQAAPTETTPGGSA